MASNIFNIAQSALTAAQVGISTTGHNIANASTPGYSRQVVIQGTAPAQNFGYGYIGQGTHIENISRVFDQLLARQVTDTQSSSNELSTYSAQMQQIDNMLSDSAAGLSPALQGFFGSINGLSANPGDASARQAMLSSAQSLANRFHGLNNRLQDIRQGVNTQLTSSVDLVNAYAQQIAKLNDGIEKAMGANGNPPNDLMDQRDQLVSELSKQIKTTIVKQDGGKYNVFIGNGLPLVVGGQTYALSTANSATDPSRLEVAYQNGNTTAILKQDSLSGGVIGGLIQFRSQSLDNIQNELGLIAVVLAKTFNDQHAQALDATGQPGGDFFTSPVPTVSKNTKNTGNASLSSEIVDVKALTSSDYSVAYDGSNYAVTRISDGSVQSFTSLPQTVDGLQIKIDSGAMAIGDEFLIRPTFSGASDFGVAITDTSKIAAGGPILNGIAGVGNTGSATISAPVVSGTYAAAPLAAPMVLSYAGGTNTLSGFPAAAPVTVTVGGTSTTYSAGTPVPYTAGATIEVAGIKLQLSGAPADGDQFTITPNTTNGTGDNRNALLLAGLQTSSVMANGTASYEGAFNRLVSLVGNKTHELQVTGNAESQMLDQAITTQQSQSGVNLDEEATNLLRYQQAYQAAGKIMQIANQMFDVLLSLG